MLHKIIPFLVWFHTYSPHIGRAQVPALADMYSERLQIVSFWIWLAGIATTSAGIVGQSGLAVRGGAILLAASLVVFVVNVAKILAHVFHPELKPFLAAAKK